VVRYYSHGIEDTSLPCQTRSSDTSTLNYDIAPSPWTTLDYGPLNFPLNVLSTATGQPRYVEPGHELSVCGQSVPNSESLTKLEAFKLGCIKVRSQLSMRRPKGGMGEVYALCVVYVLVRDSAGYIAVWARMPRGPRAAVGFIFSCTPALSLATLLESD
jgi:hypothetical protein